MSAEQRVPFKEPRRKTRGSALGEWAVFVPALRKADRKAPGNSLGPQFLSTHGVAGTALSAFYTLGPHSEGGGDSHPFYRGTRRLREVE